jgi:hypothetical protein
MMLMTLVEAFDGFSMTPNRSAAKTVAVAEGVNVTMEVAVVVESVGKFPTVTAEVEV